MYVDIPLGLSLAFVCGGLWLLTWSANRFVDASSVVARRLGVSPFVIGMVVIGFGTSAPKLASAILTRDLGVMVALSLSIGIFGLNLRRPREDGRITRLEAGIWVVSFIAYLLVTVIQERT